MSFNFFPHNYKPKISYARTRSYISHYISLLNVAIAKKFNAQYVDYPYIAEALSGINGYTSEGRTISFDNKYTSEVNELIYDGGNYLRQLTTTTFIDHDLSLYTYGPFIQRDIKEENGESMITQQFCIEIKIVNKNNYQQQLVQLINNVFSTICLLNKDPTFIDIKTDNYAQKNINCVDINQINKKYRTLPINQAVSRYVVANGPTIIMNPYKPCENGAYFLRGIPLCDDYDLSCVLCVFNETTNSVIPLIKATVRPSAETIKKQLIHKLPSTLHKGLYNESIFSNNKLAETFGLKIYFSNLMLINLHKYHLSEVVHSAWSTDFIKYIKQNKIEVM